ncbi:Proline/serine-rich protein C17A5.10 [Wallemia ichthyophaga EXF-994]|uniref:Proline/serine-rich protein C17A5.10 n=1 Tax=Wallemia ichthyophaga (strain EXF-994 / CBS 113033) TaxID=1299270 RepID=R9AH88_WALI9|nr:Proline/serine-rich protein C17A5.10 [Wallemia ichthyophaga EXF-994]EOR01495.1 Proline/serine-rich protein C17A5.10 [Wallemia ichthyophaga EXF-994]TIB34674.1 hypothetical protein E3P84_01687 [Wallemia ichthyophaga]TIB41828.1 hypothetical protein E3P83_01636 [Wallemia ichthyophaga]
MSLDPHDLYILALYDHDMLNSTNPFARLVAQEGEEQRQAQHQHHAPPDTPDHPPKATPTAPAPSPTPPPLPNRPHSPPQPPRPSEPRPRPPATALEQRYEEEEPPPYEEVMSDRVLEQGPRRPYPAAPVQSTQHTPLNSYHTNSPATPVHTRPVGGGYGGNYGNSSQSHQPYQPYSYRPNYSGYHNSSTHTNTNTHRSAPHISGIIRSGRPPPGAVVYQSGDPRIGGSFCYKCDGTGKRTDWLFGFSETCYKCGGIGRRFH